MPTMVPPSSATHDPPGSVPQEVAGPVLLRRSSCMELPVTGMPWPAVMPSNPLSKAATAAGTSSSVIWRNVTMAIGRCSGRRQKSGPPALVGS